jgi:hypothetical protein
MAFSNYEDRDRNRRYALLTGAAVFGVAASFSSVRKAAATAVLKGMTRAGRKVTQEGIYGIQGTVAQLRSTLDHQIVNAARMSRGAFFAEGRLTDLFQDASRLGLGTAEAKQLSRQFIQNADFRRFLVSSHHVNDLFENREIAGILDRLTEKSILGTMGGTPLDAATRRALRERQAKLLAESLTLARNEVPSIADVEGKAFVTGTQRLVKEQALGMLQGRSRQSLRDRALGIFGVKDVRFGDVGKFEITEVAPGVKERIFATNAGYPLNKLAGELSELGGEGLALKTRIGGLYQVGDQIYDLRKAGIRGHQALNWFKEHLQVPLAPGAMGINPFQLFPWMQGRLTSDFGHISEVARDATLRSVLGSKGPGVGQEVFKVGNRLISMNTAAETAEEAARLLEQEGGFRSGLYGFMKRRGVQVEEALAARAERRVEWGSGLQGRIQRMWNWTGLGRSFGESTAQRATTALTKYKEDSTWAPRVLNRIFAKSAEEVTLQDLHRAVGFLTSADLPLPVQRQLASMTQGKGGIFSAFPALRMAAADLETGDGALNFLRRAAELSTRTGGPRLRFQDARFRELVNQYISNPGGVMRRFEPGADHSIFGWNWLGRKSDRHAADIVRRAVYDELIGQVSASQGEEAFLTLVRGMGLKGSEQASALGYGYGRLIQRGIKPDDTQTLRQAMEKTVNFLKGQPDAKEALEAFSRAHTRPWNAHSETEELLLRSSELFSQRTHGPQDWLRDYNTARREGTNFLSSFWRATTGKTGRQFSALFTGKQEDVTDLTLMLEYFPRRLNDYFGEVGLGLAPEDLLTPASIMGNLFAKRVVPAVAGVELYRYADHKAHEYGMNGPSDYYANLRGNLGVVRAKRFGEHLPLLGRRELFPGLEKFLPLRNEEEERIHQERGLEPVRKGRYWFLGSRGEFWGEKIDYYLPSAVRTARSRWQEAENTDLNTEDYWEHSWLPLPENHFGGPLTHLLDRYWWEKKHSTGPNADRPYLVTGDLFDPNTIHGPALNATLGRLIKPRRVLYPGFLPTELGGSASREQLREINEAIKQGLDQRGVATVVGGTGGPRGFGGTGLYSPGYVGGAGGFLGSLGQVTPGGQLKLMGVPSDMKGEDWLSLGQSSVQRQGWGHRLSKREIARINRETRAGAGGLVQLRNMSALRMSQQTAPWSDDDLDMVDFENGTLLGMGNVTDVMGLYGFFARQAYDFKQKGPLITNPNRAYGWERRFYELGLGGLGGPLSEVGRRFLTRRGNFEEWNPLRNTMPGWLPGHEYFLDLLHGDPYTKIDRGELRLPGEAYERSHSTQLMQTRASSLGKSVPELMRQMLFLDEPMSEQGEVVTSVGTRIHREIQRRWKRMGVLVAAEQEITNSRMGISGHYDAILRTQQGLKLVDIKTVSDRRFQLAKKQPFDDHLTQLNFYMGETGVHEGSILYVNRDAPWQLHWANAKFNKQRLNEAFGRVEEARSQLRMMMDRGEISRGDLYDPVTRFEILADVAPYSENYGQLREYLVERHKAGQLDGLENERFQAAKKRVAAQKRRVNLTPYRFRNMDLEHRSFKVAKILDANTFMVEGSDNPIRLAGARSSNDRIEEEWGPAPRGMTAAEWQFAQYGIKPGSGVQVALEGDPERKFADDVLKTQHAVVYANGKNINLDLIQRGVGTEKETDWSDTGVAARFTPGELLKGKMWEWFAHLDTPFHGKFLRTRSPLEELRRGIVYGKNTGGWQHPFRDYIAPTVSSFVAKDPITAGLSLGAFTTLFFGKRVGKASAFKWGAGLGAGMSLMRIGWEKLHGEAWKPKRTRRREELEEYWDVLKYTKFRALAAQEEELAKEKEGTDISEMVREMWEEGESRKRRRYWLEDQKRQIKTGKRQEKEEGELASIQDSLDKLAEPRELMKLGPHATRALAYRNMYRGTLYGINPGETPFLSLFSAMPKYKRELLQGFLEKSDEKERKEIYRLLPRAEQRVLGKYLGMDEEDLPERPLLQEFFKKHPLPDKHWAGWKATTDLELLRQRAIKGEGLDPMESGLYPVQIENAEEITRNIPVPTIEGETHQIRQQLNELLSGRGLKNVRVEVSMEPQDDDADDLHVWMNLRHHREADIQNALQLHGT